MLMGRRKARLLWKQPTKSCHSWSNNLASCLWQSYTSLLLKTPFTCIAKLSVTEHFCGGRKTNSPTLISKSTWNSIICCINLSILGWLFRGDACLSTIPWELEKALVTWQRQLCLCIAKLHWRQLSDTWYHGAAIIQFAWTKTIQYMVALFFLPLW